MTLIIRDAVPADAATIDRFVRELARYERLEHEVEATPADFAAALFAPDPKVFALICESEGQAVGFCVWFLTFSTFQGRHGIYVEDVFVDPAHRGRGIGGAIFRHLAARAVREGWGRMEWSVLDWNEPAISFYRSIGAEPIDGWHRERLTGEALRALAAAAQ
jgi:GNAT superfamily N-acetyltransferase